MSNDVRDLLPPNRATACHRCRRKKIKCSEGHPCPNCQQAGLGTECSYPSRSTSVKIPQKVIDELLAEIDRLRESNSELQHQAAHEAGRDAATTASPGLAESALTPLHARANAGISPESTLEHEISAEVDDLYTQSIRTTQSCARWFDCRNLLQDPVLIGETADAAFATRFRQVISLPGAPETHHLLRMSYVSNEALMASVENVTLWPSPRRATFLVEAALKYLGRCHYIVHRDKTTNGFSQTLVNPSWGGSAIRSKFWVLFALGELYVTKFTATSTGYPGVRYFAQASKLLGVLDERPGLDSIEALLLLSLYSLALNRRYSAYTLGGTAMRSAIVMGLHLEIPESQMPDRLARDHRKRVFWTTYMFDRMWGAHLNLPAAIQDNEIEIGFPSPVEWDNPTVLTPGSSSVDHAFLMARISLVRHLTSVIASVYSNRPTEHGDRLSTRVQRALKHLQDWNDKLSPHLQLDQSVGSSNDVNVVSLHLSFYQVLRGSVVAARNSISPLTTEAPRGALALSEACAKYARHSVRLLTQSWMEGTFMSFDCFFTQYLFSSMTVLAVSSLLTGKDNETDRELFEEAAHLLRQLRDTGNCIAQEYCPHVEAMTAAITEYLGKSSGNLDTAMPLDKTGFDQSLPPLTDPLSHELIAAAFPWEEPSLQMLFNQPGLDMRFLDAGGPNEYPENPLGSINAG